MERKDLLFPSVIALALSIEEHALSGWKLDMTNPPIQFGWQWKCGFVKNETKQTGEPEVEKRKAGRPSQDKK